jgi:outer membrane lipoprotein-sorting protein
MHNPGLVFVLGLFSFTASAQYAGYKPATDPSSFKSAFAAASQKINSIRSEFVQEKSLSMLDEKMISQGKFFFKKENRVRMEYEKPFQYLMIINNNQVLIRDGEKENKISAKSNKTFSQINRIMIDCVQGTMLTNPDFSVRVFENNQHWLVELTPLAKSMKDLFKSIGVTVDKSDLSASQIEMSEINGDNTVIRLTNKTLNVEIPDSLFSIH